VDEPPAPQTVEAAPVWARRHRRALRAEFAESAYAPSEMRDLVRAAARSWGLGDVGALAALLVSELVTNAVEHGGSGGVVEVEALPAGLRVRVTDHSPVRPQVQHPRADEPAGRGLSIVDQLSRRWGVEVASAEKTVWFEVDDVDLSSHG